METQTRFDLNAAIATWQQELAAQADLTPIVRRELESHLRDTVAELQGSGLNDEEAFWLARRRVGQPRQLGEEFAKADPSRIWRDRAFWMVFILLFTTLWQTTVFSLNNINILKTESFFLAVRVLLVFVGWLPILVGAFFLSKGRISPLVVNRLAFFNSRVRAAIAAYSWIGLTAIYHSFDLFLRLEHTRSNNRGSIWFSVLMSVVVPAIGPICLTALLLWIMPRRSHSAVQHA